MFFNWTNIGTIVTIIGIELSNLFNIKLDG